MTLRIRIWSRISIWTSGKWSRWQKSCCPPLCFVSMDICLLKNTGLAQFLLHPGVEHLKFLCNCGYNDIRNVKFGWSLEILPISPWYGHGLGRALSAMSYNGILWINPKWSTLFTRSLLYSLNYEIANPNLVSDFDLDIGKVVPLAEIMLPPFALLTKAVSLVSDSRSQFSIFSCQSLCKRLFVDMGILQINRNEIWFSTCWDCVCPCLRLWILHKDSQLSTFPGITTTLRSVTFRIFDSW